MSTRLQNKTALVTGSSQGLGRAIALSFAHHGAYLVVCADLEPGRKPHITLPDKASEELSNRHNNEVSATQRTTTDVENPESAGSCKTSGMSKRSLQVHSDVDQGDDDDDDQHATHKLICKLYGDGKAVFVECDVGKEEGERGMKRAVEEAAGRGRWGLNM